MHPTAAIVIAHLATLAIDMLCTSIQQEDITAAQTALFRSTKGRIYARAVPDEGPGLECQRAGYQYVSKDAGLNSLSSTMEIWQSGVALVVVWAWERRRD